MFVMPLVLAAAIQQQVLLPPPPRTHLEAMLLQAGAVVVQGSSLAGFVRGLDGTGVGVRALEVTDTASGSKEYGFSIDVRQPVEHAAARAAIAYVDYDEIAPMLAALDRLIAMNSTVTRLDRFEGDYRTAGDLRVSVFSTRDGVFAAVAAGGAPLEPLATASFHIADLQLLRNLVAQGKATIDTARQ
ncbi:MAG TPA: hypothetical protein VFX12_02295 [Vicinamibacterales bacterium]|nr:hypothetical protein [Vicinamibacterales bacterium]